MTKTEFKQLLEDFDWYYNMTDDHKVWLKESAKADKIYEITQKDPKFLELFLEVRKEKTGYEGSAFPGVRVDG